jgi:hypothetical protein
MCETEYKMDDRMKNRKPKNHKFDHVTLIIKSLPNRFAIFWSIVKPIMKKISGYAFRLISILVVVAILWGLGTLFVPLLNSASSTGINSLDDVLPTDSSRPTINIKFGEPDWSIGKPFVPTKFDSKIELPQETIWINGGCFIYLYDFVYVKKSAFTEPIRYGRGGSPQTTLNPKLCFTGSNEKIYTAPDLNWVNGDHYSFISGLPPYYYPFDWAEIKLHIRLEGYENVGTKTVNRYVPVNVTGEVEAKNWDIKITISDGVDSLSMPSSSQVEIRPNVLVNIRYERPLVYRIIPAVLLLTILLIILIVPLIKDNGSFLEVLVGLIFGIWGIKQIIIPTFVTWTTILDPIILGLYMCLCVSVLIKFVIMPLQAKVDRYARHQDE